MLKFLFLVYLNVLYVFIVIQLACTMLTNSMYLGLKKRSYRIIKSWFHTEMLSLIVHFFVCSILKASFVVNDATEGLGIPMKTLLLITIDMSFLVEASVFCAVIWKVKDFNNDEFRPRTTVPAAEENTVVEVGIANNCEETGSNGEQYTHVSIEETINEEDPDDDDKPPAYEECVINLQDSIAPPKYEDISDVV